MMARNMLRTKLYILTEKIKRKNDRGSFLITMAYVDLEKSVKQITLPQLKHFENSLQKGKYYLCSNVAAIGETVRLTESSKVFETSPFEMNQSVIDTYLNPPQETVEEILQSPQKRMVSVRGILRKSSQIIESPNSKRKEITIESMEGTSRVVCKLWGDHADKCLPQNDEVVTVCNVEVATFKDIISLNSTLLTSIKESEENTIVEGKVEGVDFREDFSYLIIDTKTYKVKTTELERIFPRGFEQDIHIKGSAHGFTIVELEKINPAKKPKRD
ncbi:uncharacterized protein LOC134279703 [Saccostrea cucullata]|uniref:uncharacterized protein LOC134279703 n=1 Tax=Saccostrea cuccullata TaxID=36930 RepID=UPI002ED5390F